MRQGKLQHRPVQHRAAKRRPTFLQQLEFRRAGEAVTRPSSAPRYAGKGGKQGSGSRGGGAAPRLAVGTPLPRRQRPSFFLVQAFRRTGAVMGRSHIMLPWAPISLHARFALSKPTRRKPKGAPVTWIARKKKRRSFAPMQPARPLTEKEREAIEIALAWERGDYAALIAWGVIEPALP